VTKIVARGRVRARIFETDRIVLIIGGGVEPLTIPGYFLAQA